MRGGVDGNKNDKTTDCHTVDDEEERQTEGNQRVVIVAQNANCQLTEKLYLQKSSKHVVHPH